MQAWAPQVATVLRQAHTAVTDATAAGRDQLDPQLLADLRTRYDKAVHWGVITNRCRDWHDGNHPGYKLAKRLQTKADQVWLFTTVFTVPWTNNASEQAIKSPKLHQKVSGYWHHEHPRRVLPRPLLPGQRPRPRHPRDRRHPHRPGRQTLAPHTRHRLATRPTREWTHPVEPARRALKSDSCSSFGSMILPKRRSSLHLSPQPGTRGYATEICALTMLNAPSSRFGRPSHQNHPAGVRKAAPSAAGPLEPLQGGAARGRAVRAPIR